MKSLRGLGASPCLLWSEVPPASGKMVQRRAPPSPPRPCEALVTGGGGRSRSVNCVQDLGSPPLGDSRHSPPQGGKGGGLSSSACRGFHFSCTRSSLSSMSAELPTQETWKFSAVVLLLLCLPQGPGVLGRCCLSQRRHLRDAPHRRHVIAKTQKRLLISERSDSKQLLHRSGVVGGVR